MKSLRALLEEIKKFDDKRREAEGDPPEDAMTLFPPAAPAAAQKLLKTGWSHPLPPSFGEFLAASDGVVKFRGNLDFVGTDSKRQAQVRSVIEEQIEEDRINLRAIYKTVDDAVIAKSESDPDQFHVANHPVIAVTEMGGLLFYDSRTRDAKGEMDLCWRSPADAQITSRYKNIQEYLESALKEAKEEAAAS